MKIRGNEIRPGHVLEHQGQLWLAVKTSHVKPGKGGAFAQVELKNLSGGQKMQTRFRATEDVERVRLEQKEYRYLYRAQGKLTLMDPETYEQIELSEEMLGARAQFLQDGMALTVESHQEKPIGLVLPEQVTLQVRETEPVVKGQTAAKSNKPAILENGLRVMVPVFVQSGDRLVIDTADGAYIKRAD